MNKITYVIIYFLSQFFIFFSCSRIPTPSKESTNIEQLERLDLSPTEVQTVVVRRQPFNRELLANGKLYCARRSELRFTQQGYIKTIFVKEGQYVSEGAVIAQLDDNELYKMLENSQLEFKKAKLDYEDHLLRLGFRLEDTVKMDNELKEISMLRSGFSNAKINLERTKQLIKSAKLFAPFSGRIANLRAKPHNSTSSYDFICALIDDSQLTAEFKVLEQELSFILESNKIRLLAFSSPSKSYSGYISSVNPIVDEAGMVSIKADLENTGNLMHGMSVQVVVVKEHPNQLIVPKESVLERQGSKVIFSFVDGRAQWNDVEISDENSTHYAISNGLKEGDEIIHKGNFNLSHDKIVVKKN